MQKPDESSPVGLLFKADIVHEASIPLNEELQLLSTCFVSCMKFRRKLATMDVAELSIAWAPAVNAAALEFPHRGYDYHFHLLKNDATKCIISKNPPVCGGFFVRTESW